MTCSNLISLLLKLLLMKRGGQVIYAGPLGHHSQKLIEYFEVSLEAFICLSSQEFLIPLLHTLSGQLLLFIYKALVKKVKTKFLFGKP